VGTDDDPGHFIAMLITALIERQMRAAVPTAA
jgi:hypothetical protein